MPSNKVGAEMEKENHGEKEPLKYFLSAADHLSASQTAKTED